jgi:class 3 adenylate cyclase
MAEPDRIAVILFVDICDSTPLFENRGDEAALGAISGTLDLLENLVRHHGGEVVRAKGDDLLCVFEVPVAALDAALEMMQQVAGDGLAVRIGMHHGPLIEARGDIFGDAVNVAARMLDLAKPGETLATEAVVQHLDETNRERLTPLGRQSLKGKEEPVRIYSLIHDDGASTQFVHSNTVTELSRRRHERTLVILEYRTQRRVLRPGDADLRLGRSPRSDLIINETAVSREHATIRVAPGRVTFTDHSSTGSWMGSAGAEDVTAIRRESVQLDGDGVLFLGYPPDDGDDAPCVGFSVQGVSGAVLPLEATAAPAGTPQARREPRFPVDDLGVFVFKGQGSTGLRAQVTNISYKGAMLVSRHRLGEPQERMQVALNDSGATVNCELRFVGAADDDDAGRFAHGVMFSGVDTTAREAIEAVLRAQGQTADA